MATHEDLQEAINNNVLAGSWRFTNESQTKFYDLDASKLTPRMAQFKLNEQNSPWKSRDLAIKALDSANYSNFDNRTAYRQPGDREAGSAIEFTRSQLEGSDLIQIDKESPGVETLEKTDVGMAELMRDSAHQSMLPMQDNSRELNIVKKNPRKDSVFVDFASNNDLLNSRRIKRRYNKFDRRTGPVSCK